MKNTGDACLSRSDLSFLLKKKNVIISKSCPLSKSHYLYFNVCDDGVIYRGKINVNVELYPSPITSHTNRWTDQT